MRHALMLCLLLAACGPLGDPAPVPPKPAAGPAISVAPAVAFAGTDTEVFTVTGSGFAPGAWESSEGSVGPASWAFANVAQFVQRAELAPLSFALTGPFEGRLQAQLLAGRWRGKTMTLCLSLPSAPAVVCAAPNITIASQ